MRDDEGEGHGRIAGIEPQAKKVRKAEEHYNEHYLSKHSQHAGEHGVRRRLDGEVAGKREAHRGGVDAEQRAGAFLDGMFDVANGDQNQKCGVRGKSEPENQRSEGF